MKILTVVGARPQIIKSAAITHSIKNHFSKEINEILVHTGQHYDQSMSDRFFRELGIPAPLYNLGIGSSGHGEQTGAMLSALEATINSEMPDVVLIYGDTNSTVAAALAAAKLGVPVAHIEAGMRSFNKSMPEEINRVLSDHASTYLFCPTEEAVGNLIKEGFVREVEQVSIDKPYVTNVGDVMYDNALMFAPEGDRLKKIDRFELRPDAFVLATIHRASNTQSKQQVNSILNKLSAAAVQHNLEVILPLHPRTKAVLGAGVEDLNDQFKNTAIRFVEPLGYLDILWCAKNAALVVTDSGGLQKEAAFFNTASVVLRSETEWVELLENGLVQLTSMEDVDFLSKFEEQLKGDFKLPENFYGDGKAAFRILKTLLEKRA